MVERKIQPVQLNETTTPSTTVLEKKKTETALTPSNRKLHTKSRTRSNLNLINLAFMFFLVNVSSPVTNEVPVSTITLNVTSKQPFIDEATRVQQSHACNNLFKHTGVKRESSLFITKENDKMVLNSGHLGPQAKKICLEHVESNIDNKKDTNTDNASNLNGTMGHLEETSIKLMPSNDNSSLKVIIGNCHNQKTANKDEKGN